jgi:predicted Zn-dependent peptidase
MSETFRGRDLISRVKFLRASVVTSVLLLLFSVFVPISEAGLKACVFETHLPNGLKVLLLENHKAPVTTFQVWYRVGSRDEEWVKTGLSHLLPANAFLVIVGDFNREDLLQRIQEAFGPIPRGIEPQRYRYEDPPQTGERRVLARKEAQLAFLIMAYHVPNLREPDSYLLEVIATIISGGKSSRLYQRLVQKEQVALTADAEHSLLSLEPGLFYISAEPFPGKDAGEVEKLIDQELERLQSDPVGEAELEKAKNQLVTLRVLMDAGSWRDPLGKEGLANLTARGLLLVTSRHSDTEINDALDFMGADLDSSSTWLPEKMC